MKKLVLMVVPALICGVLLTSCGSKLETDEDCNGCTMPQENLPWLKELIQKAESDNTLTQANYWGCIWLEKYKGQDIFVTNMMLGSGGVLYWFFDCAGNHFISKNWGYEICTACKYVGNHHVFFEDVFEDSEKFDSFVSNMKLDVVVYSRFSIPCK